MFLKCLSFQFLLFLCSLGLRLALRPIPSPTLPLLSFWGLPSLAPRVSLGGGALAALGLCYQHTAGHAPPFPRGCTLQRTGQTPSS